MKNARKNKKKKLKFKCKNCGSVYPEDIWDKALSEFYEDEERLKSIREMYEEDRLNEWYWFCLNCSTTELDVLVEKVESSDK